MTVSTQSFRVTGIDIIAYMVKDTQRALDFYRDILGLVPTKVYPEAGGAEFELADGATFGLVNGKEAMPWRAGNGVMFAVDDLQAAVSTVRDRGAPIHLEYESPVCFMALTEDSEGNQIILHKRKPD